MIPWWETAGRLVLAVLLGGLIGFERESVDKPAGFRTHILVCVGAALFALVSREGFFGSGADPSRVASNIVVGIGFLGVERRLPRRGAGHCVVLMADVPGQLGKIGTVLGTLGVNIDRVELTEKIDQRVLLDMMLRLPLRITREEVLAALGEIEGVDEAQWEA